MRAPTRTSALLTRVGLCGAALLAAAAVSAAPASPRQVARAQGVPVPFVTLKNCPSGPWVESVTVLARSERDWEDAMLAQERDHKLCVVPGPDAPAIDWADSAVLLVSYGELDNYSGLQIRGLRAVGSRLVVELDVVLGTGCSAFHLVAVDRRLVKAVKSVVFESRYVPMTGPEPSLASAAASGKPVVATLERVTLGAVKGRYR